MVQCVGVGRFRLRGLEAPNIGTVSFPDPAFFAQNLGLASITSNLETPKNSRKL